MATKDKTWELLNAYLDGDFRVLPMAPNKSSKQDISYIENKLEIKFPEEYKIHLLGDNDEILGTRGIYVEALESVWQRPKALDVGPFWSFFIWLAHLYCVKGK